MEDRSDSGEEGSGKAFPGLNKIQFDWTQPESARDNTYHQEQEEWNEVRDVLAFYSNVIVIVITALQSV